MSVVCEANRVHLVMTDGMIEASQVPPAISNFAIPDPLLGSDTAPTISDSFGRVLYLFTLAFKTEC